MVQGNGYLGSLDLLVSTANTEIIPSPPTGWTSGYSLYKLNFLNNQDCHIKINNGTPIYLRVFQGFNMNESDKKITSFVIVESGVTFSWIGNY